jgi:hypothetical protein
MVLFNADARAGGLTPLENALAISRTINPPPELRAIKPLQSPNLDPASTSSNDLCKHLSPDERKKIASCQDK